MKTPEPLGGPRDLRSAAERLMPASAAADAARPPALVEGMGADVDAPAQAPSYMSFRVGELGLLVPSSAGREVIQPPPMTRVPNTVSWLRGVANVRGDLVPVVDLASAFAVTRRAGVPVYMMIAGHAETALGLLIDGLPGLFRLEQTERLSGAPAVAALLAETVVGAYQHAGRTWLEVDPDVLFDAIARHLALA